MTVVVAPATKAPIGQSEDTAVLLGDVVNYVRRFVVLNEEQLHVLALWILHTYTFTSFEQTPYLHVRAPEKQSGKTRLLEVLNLLVHDPWMVQMPSEAVLFRKIDEEHPTLLLDEVDAIFQTNGDSNVEGVRALLNGGNREESSVPRLVGGDHKPKDFSVFCPKALAGIGEVPETVADRAIPLFLKRKTPDEVVERFRRRLDTVSQPAGELCARMTSWADTNAATLKDSWPQLPEVLSDRQMDNVEPLLAVADLAGQGWSDYAREAVVGIYERYAEGEGTSLSLRLLGDCRTVFQGFGNPDALRSSDLVHALKSIEDGPWGEDGRELTPQKLAWHLKKYEIRPKKIRFEEPTGSVNGYERESFADVWERWLPRAEG